jgi:hypothetical protein
MNKLLKGFITFIYVVGIFLVFTACLGAISNHRKLAITLITLGAILCLFFHFVSYKEAIKNNDSINYNKTYFRLVSTLVMLGLALLWLFFKRVM